jgi:flagellar secretion chaperone FliS
MTTSYQMYSSIEMDTEVMSASGHRLIQLLLDKSVHEIQSAKMAIQKHDLPKKHAAIARAQDIINYLRACLDFKDATNDLAGLLDSIYAFLEKSLLLATLKDDIEFLNQAELVLSNIKEGWDGIALK